MAISYSLDTRLSPKYRLRDLVVTSTGVPNIPTDDYMVENLKTLADALERLEMLIGPLVILSAYRSPALQQAIIGGAAGAASARQAATYSLHEEGMAADIAPISKNAQKYFADIAASPDAYRLLGEIAIKANSLHISLPTARKQAYFMYVNSSDQYIHMSEAEVEDYIEKHKGETSSAAPVSAAEEESEYEDTGYEEGGGGVFILGIAALGLVALLALRARKGRRPLAHA
jgi:hypothetical protein